MIDPTELYNKALNSAEEWADKDNAAGVLEDALGTLEGVLCAEYKAKGEPVSIMTKLIKQDQRWINAAKAWREARKHALVARLKYEQVNRYQDNIRTRESTERQLAR